MINATIRNNTVAQPVGNTQGIRVSHNGNASADSNICLDISGNTSAGPGAFLGIGLRKAGTSTSVDLFGLEGLPDPAPVGEGSPAVENYVNSLNPSGGGTLLVSATSGSRAVRPRRRSLLDHVLDRNEAHARARPRPGRVLPVARSATPHPRVLECS